MFGIIVGTHGGFSEELLRGCEMICGVTKNVKAVSMFPREGMEIMLKKYQEAVTSMDTDGRILFLNDIFGGTPYNAACRLVMKNEQYGIVSGANLPMLIEMISEQLSDEQTDILGLMDKAVQAGRAGMHVFHASTLREIR